MLEPGESADESRKHVSMPAALATGDVPPLADEFWNTNTQDEGRKAFLLDVARLGGVLQSVDGCSRADGSVAVPLHGRLGSVGAGNVVEPGGPRAAAVADLGAALSAGGTSWHGRWAGTSLLWILFMDGFGITGAPSLLVAVQHTEGRGETCSATLNLSPGSVVGPFGESLGVDGMPRRAARRTQARTAMSSRFLAPAVTPQPGTCPESSRSGTHGVRRRVPWARPRLVTTGCLGRDEG